MESIHAKSRALQKYCDELRKAIVASGVSINFKLYREGLITQEVREEKAAERIVSVIENRLASDEFLWDNLIGVLRECEYHLLANNLEAQLQEELKWDKRSSRVSLPPPCKFSYRYQTVRERYERITFAIFPNF